jgi:hypothetical protein
LANFCLLTSKRVSRQLDTAGAGEQLALALALATQLEKSKKGLKSWIHRHQLENEKATS